MVGLLSLTGGASLVTMWVYQHWENKTEPLDEHSKTPAWWQRFWLRRNGEVLPTSPAIPPHKPSTPTTAPGAELPCTTPRQTTGQRVDGDYELRTSTLALAVTTAGRLCYPPLQVAGLPLLVYMGIPAAQKAYEQLGAEERPGHALAETVVLAVCLAGGYYWVGSLGFWLYYGSRRLLAKQQPGVERLPPVWLAPTTTRRWHDGAASVVATASLQPGDQVILHSGEVAPVDGLIIKGVAWLRPQALSAAACGLRKEVGDKVAVHDIVLVGEIYVQVLPSA
jgi:hypothetical protein